MIICDTGPLVSAINRGEGRRHLLAADLLGRLGRNVIVPWPVLVEVDLLLRSRGHPAAAVTFARSLAAVVHRLEAPTAPEFQLALKLAERYLSSGVDLPDLIVMAMASHRQERILTRDFRRFRAVVLGRGHHRPLVVEETELPAPWMVWVWTRCSVCSCYLTTAARPVAFEVDDISGIWLSD